MRKTIIAVTAIGILLLAAGAGAASRYLITSTHQIKPSVLRQLHGQNGRNGAQGPAGVTGATGAAGPAGTVPGIITVDSPKETLPSGTNTFTVDPNGFEATCPAGYSVLGTGFNDGGIGNVGFVLSFGTFVGGFISNNSGITDTDVYIQAMCGQVAGGSAGANSVHGASAEARYHADIMRAQAAANHS